MSASPIESRVEPALQPQHAQAAPASVDATPVTSDHDASPTSAATQEPRPAPSAPAPLPPRPPVPAALPKQQPRSAPRTAPTPTPPSGTGLPVIVALAGATLAAAAAIAVALLKRRNPPPSPKAPVTRSASSIKKPTPTASQRPAAPKSATAVSTPRSSGLARSKAAGSPSGLKTAAKKLPAPEPVQQQQPAHAAQVASRAAPGALSAAAVAAGPGVNEAAAETAANAAAAATLAKRAAEAEAAAAQAKKAAEAEAAAAQAKKAAEAEAVAAQAKKAAEAEAAAAQAKRASEGEAAAAQATRAADAEAVAAQAKRAAEAEAAAAQAKKAAEAEAAAAQAKKAAEAEAAAAQAKKAAEAEAAAAQAKRAAEAEAAAAQAKKAAEAEKVSGARSLPTVAAASAEPATSNGHPAANGHASANGASSSNGAAAHADAAPASEDGAKSAAPIAAAKQPEPETKPEPELNSDEQHIKKLMIDASNAWNHQDKKTHALKLGRQTMELIHSKAIRPRLVAQAATMVADMYFAANQLEAAEAVVKQAIDAAQEVQHHALVVKLHNNLAAIYRTKEAYDDALAVYEKVMPSAVAELGVGHALTQLTRQSMADVLDTKGCREEARVFLQKALEDIAAEEQSALAALQAAGLPDAPFLVKVLAPGEEEQEEAEDAEPEEVVALRRVRLSRVRTYNELAKLELRDERHPEAEAQFLASLAKCKEVYGEMSPEAGTPLYALANLYRVMGRPRDALDLYHQLYDVTLRTQGTKSDNAVGLARAMVDVFSELEEHEKAAEYAQKALESMQQMVGGFHPALQPYYDLLGQCLVQSGNLAAADQLKSTYLRQAVQYRTALAPGGKATTKQAQGAKAGAAAPRKAKK